MNVTDKDMDDLTELVTHGHHTYQGLPYFDPVPFTESGFYKKLFVIGKETDQASTGASLFLFKLGNVARLELTEIKVRGNVSSSKKTHFFLDELIVEGYEPDHSTHLKSVMKTFNKYGYGSYDKLMDGVNEVFYVESETQSELSMFWEQAITHVVDTLYMYKTSPKTIYLYVATLCSLWLDFKTQNKIN